MPGQLFLQNVIALIWDFDKTFIPGYMQSPLFKHFEVDENQFWAEVNALPEEYHKRGAHRASKDSVYLNHILTYVQAGIFRLLTNDLLRKLGAELVFYPGLPEFFEIVKKEARGKPEYVRHEVAVENYITSTGLRAMIEGSKIAPYVDEIWACEFVEGRTPPGYLVDKLGKLLEDEAVITDIAYTIDNTSKTRAVFEINKGTNKLSNIDVNASIPQTDRRVPFQNMIYVADGPSEIPVFSVVNQYGGQTADFSGSPRKPRQQRASARDLAKVLERTETLGHGFVPAQSTLHHRRHARPPGHAPHDESPKPHRAASRSPENGANASRRARSATGRPWHRRWSPWGCQRPGASRSRGG
jgi:hypothetical protein